MYSEALIEKVARRIAIWNDDEDAVEGVIWQPYIGDAVAALDALGLREEQGEGCRGRTEARYVTEWEPK